jgi:hypothetical protein
MCGRVDTDGLRQRQQRPDRYALACHHHHNTTASRRGRDGDLDCACARDRCGGDGHDSANTKPNRLANSGARAD